MHDALGDRMKSHYEAPSRHLLTRRMPVIVRVDGRAFHTLTASMERPFDQKLILTMVEAAKHVAHGMQGFKAAFVQSDEASFLLTDYDGLDTQPWFGYVKSKVETISASLMTAHFNLFSLAGTERSLFTYAHPPIFDARAFNIPREEVVNYFLWRAKDWERNSVQMYCRSFFSAKQMHGQGKADQHEMLHSIGKNWTTDLTQQVRNGTWLINRGLGAREYSSILPKYEDINRALVTLIDCDVLNDVSSL